MAAIRLCVGPYERAEQRALLAAERVLTTILLSASCLTPSPSWLRKIPATQLCSFSEPSIPALFPCNSSEFPLAKCFHPFRCSLSISFPRHGPSASAPALLPPPSSAQNRLLLLRPREPDICLHLGACLP